MPTHCSATGMAFGRAGGRELIAAFDGGLVTSDAGALLLGATDRTIRLVDRFASCFRDGRHPAFVTHQVRSLVGQRIFGLALGYEDLVDYDDLPHAPVPGPLWAGSRRGRHRSRAARWQEHAQPAGAC